MGEGARAVAFAQRAAGAAPGVPAVQITLCEALLASGAIAQAESVAARLCATAPLDQHAIALQATAWRLLGDARYAALYDYAQLTHAETIDAPLEYIYVLIRETPGFNHVKAGKHLPDYEAKKR